MSIIYPAEEQRSFKKMSRQQQQPYIPPEPRSAFLIWYMENRDEIKRNNPRIKNSKLIAKKAGKIWWEDLSIDKERYKREARQEYNTYARWWLHKELAAARARLIARGYNFGGPLNYYYPQYGSTNNRPAAAANVASTSQASGNTVRPINSVGGTGTNIATTTRPSTTTAPAAATQRVAAPMVRAPAMAPTVPRPRAAPPRAPAVPPQAAPPGAPAVPPQATVPAVRATVPASAPQRAPAAPPQALPSTVRTPVRAVAPPQAAPTTVRAPVPAAAPPPVARASVPVPAAVPPIAPVVPAVVPVVIPLGAPPARAPAAPAAVPQQAVAPAMPPAPAPNPAAAAGGNKRAAPAVGNAKAKKAKKDKKDNKKNENDKSSCVIS